MNPELKLLKLKLEDIFERWDDTNEVAPIGFQIFKILLLLDKIQFK